MRVTPVLSLCPALLSRSHTHDHRACHLPLPGAQRQKVLITHTVNCTGRSQGLSLSLPKPKKADAILAWAVLPAALPAVVAL